MPLFKNTLPATKITKTKHDFYLNLDLREYLQAWIYVFGSYELPTVKFIRSYLTSGMGAVDVGAQIGYLSLVMATSAGKDVTVQSFEPEDHNYDRLKANIELNHLVNVSTIKKAVSREPGSIKLYLSADENAGTHSTVFVKGNVSESFIEIPCTTIDQEASGRVDLIKIDVEGAEIDVIEGALDTLRSQQPVVIAELSDALQAARGLTCREFKERMAEFAYEAFIINDDGSLSRSRVDAPHLNDNVVFVPPSRVSLVNIA